MLSLLVLSIQYCSVFLGSFAIQITEHFSQSILDESNNINCKISMVGYAGLNRAKMKYLKPEVKVLVWSLNR